MVTIKQLGWFHAVPDHLLRSMTVTQSAVRREEPTAQISGAELLICQPTAICRQPAAQGGQPLWRNQSPVTSDTNPACRTRRWHIGEPFWICNGVSTLTTAGKKLNEPLLFLLAERHLLSTMVWWSGNSNGKAKSSTNRFCEHRAHVGETAFRSTERHKGEGREKTPMFIWSQVHVHVLPHHSSF